MSQGTARAGGFWWWLVRLLSGRPHVEIGGYDTGDTVRDVYLRRWFLIPRNRWFNVYLHQFLRDDDDRALHDHPWDSLSFLVRGEYREHTPFLNPVQWQSVKRYRAPALIRRTAEHRHRIELVGGKPAWTIFITGPKRRAWGFWCPQGFVPWKQFTSGEHGERIGAGCGE